MKISYIATSTIPGMAANSVHVMKMCEALQENQVDISLIIPKYRDQTMKQDEYSYYGIREKFNIVRTGFRKPPQGIWNVLFSLSAIVKAYTLKTDLIYTRSPLVARLLAFGKKNFIFEYHGIEFSRFYSQEKIFSASNLTAFVVITHSLKNYYIKKYGIDSEKIVVLPDGVNIKEYDYSNDEILQNDTLNIAYVGGLYQGRGIDIVIELAKRDKKNNYLVVGGRPDQVTYWQKELEKASLEKKNIKFLGQIPNAQVPSLLAKQDILLMPYQKKVGINGTEDTAKWMSPMKMFEYMASGRVIISSRLPVLEEILHDKENAYLVEPNDINQWLAAIKRIDRKRNEARDIATRASTDVKQYAWINRALKIIKIVEETSK